MKLTQIPLFTNEGLRGKGDLGLEGGVGADAPSTFETAISTTVGVLSAIAGVYFIIILVLGAISWMSAGPDKAKLEEAQGKIRSGIIGLVMVIAAIFVANIIGFILGFDILLNPTAIIPV